MISPRDIPIASIPLIVQKALILGPRFIYNQSLASEQIVDKLRSSQAVQFNVNQYNSLLLELNTAPKPSNTPKFINPDNLKLTMTKWLNDNNLLIQNADKNLCLTLIDKTIYQTHLDQLVTNQDLYQPMSMTEAKSFVDELNFEVKQHYYNFYKKNRYHNNINKHLSYGFPNLYLIPKIHKPKLAMRPIVNQRNFLFTEIYKDIHSYYLKVLNALPGKSQVVLDGNLDLINKITALNQLVKNDKIDLNDYQILSLDVTNLYGNIDLEDILTVIGEVSDKKKTDDVFYFKLTQLILPNSIIESQRHLYRQLNGLAMGINYAPSLANLYLFHRYDSRLVKMLYSSEESYRPILFYGRYLDDILIICHKTNLKIDKTVENVLNKIHPSIQFTTEHSINNSINFLDLTIYIQNNQLHFKNYTKDRKVNMMLHHNAHFKGKDGLIKSQSIRVMKNSSTEENYIDALTTLKDGLEARGYPTKMVENNILSYDQRAIYLDPAYKKDKKNLYEELIKEKTPISLDHHDRTDIVKKHILKVNPKAFFTFKNYANLYPTFFRNKKNTKFRWTQVQEVKTNNPENLGPKGPSKTELRKQQQLEAQRIMKKMRTEECIKNLFYRSNININNNTHTRQD